MLTRMDDGEPGVEIRFAVDSRDDDMTDVTLRVYAAVTSGAVLLGALVWWWAPTDSVWLDVGIGLVVGAVAGYVSWSLWGLARGRP